MNDIEPIPEQTVFSLSEAARITGKSKGTISNAIQKGRLSARSKEGGAYQIDAAELFRVYPLNTSNGVQNAKNEHGRTPAEPPETAGLTLQLEAAERLLDEREETIADLRRRLDAADEERRALTRMLTDQRPVIVPEPASATPTEPAGGRFGRAWSILRGRA